MDLASLVDLEWLLRGDGEPDLEPEQERAIARRLAAESAVEPAALRARLDGDVDLRRRLALAWLQAVRARRDALPGARVEHGLEVAGWILVLVGLLAGWGAAQALLAYDGSVPVNVLHLALVFFVGQILLLVAMLFFVLRPRRRGAPRRAGLLHRPIAWLAARSFGPEGHSVVEALRGLRARRSLYADVERWSLFTLAQRFGVAFNAAAVVVALILIAFTDLVFSWSTTLDLDAATVHRGVRLVALPWSWWSDAVPSLDVIEASQWSRMQGRFVGGTTDADAVRLAARWWSFLIAGLLCWGLAPRLVAWIAGSWRARRALDSLSFDHAGYQELFDRLLPPSIGWAGPAASEVVGAAPRATRRPTSAHAPVSAGAPTWVVVWGSLAKRRDAAVAGIARRFSADIQQVCAAGGAELAADAAAIAALGDARASRVVFVAAAGQQPTADVVGFLRALRQGVGAGRPLVVILLELSADGECHDAAADEREAWRRALGVLDDPHLWVESMGLPA